jgi:DNA-binding beta-propeller fold protein YncE
MIRAFLLFALAVLGVASASAQNVPLPPAPHVRIALNPITHKAYLLDETGNQVKVVDGNGATIASVPVGGRPQFIAVDPAANRIYVNNAADSSLTIIDGTSDTNITPTPFAVGSLGPMTVNPATGLVYIVRLTSAATDEVTFFNPATSTWYTIATESWQPLSMGVNPVTNTIFVAHYAGNDVRIISGAYNEKDFFPATVGVGTGRRPFAIAVNPVTNRAFVIIDNEFGPIATIDPTTSPPSASFPTVPAGHAVSPRGLAVNTVTNKAYAAFANEVVVIDGATGGLTFLPVDTGSTSAAIGINAVTNKIYVAADDGVLTVIDGDTNAKNVRTIPAGESSLAIDPITNQVYLASAGALTVLAGDAGTVHPIPLTTQITPAPNNATGANPTFTLQVTGLNSPGLPARKVYVRMDDRNGAWTAATGNGPFTASFTGLAGGAHTLYAFAADDQLLPFNSGPQSHGAIGAMTSYAFNVIADSSISIASSANPSTVGQSVTFTISVTGGPSQPSGTVTLRDGGTAIAGCGPLTLAAGSASCSAALPAGSRTLTVAYSGDRSHAAATSQPFTQVVNRNAAAVALVSSSNPAVTGAAVTFTATISGGTAAPGGSVSFADGGVAISGCEAVAVASRSARCTTSALDLGHHAIVATYSGDGAYTGATSASLDQSIQPTPRPGAQVGPDHVDFGGESMGTTTTAAIVTLTNTGNAVLNVNAVGVSGGDAAQFAATSDCQAVAAGDHCTVRVTFTPAASGGALNTTVPASATLTISHDADGSPTAVALSGSGEKSLVTHFYEAVLRRAPDADGKPFWSGEAERMAGLGANVNETWFAMSMSFFGSPEYQRFGRDDNAFLADLYATFFNRVPDADGASFWRQQMAGGMPREAVLASFMFSPEFATFTRGVFGDTAARAEVDVVMDFYRGALARLPDSDGFAFWVQRFRAAQCQGAQAVADQADAISSAVLQSGEYAGRQRTNAQYVGDLYNTFLRRGGDLDGVRTWIANLDQGRQTREDVRRAFLASDEFRQRVNAIVGQGCQS